jgi:hypothetical protein
MRRNESFGRELTSALSRDTPAYRRAHAPRTGFFNSLLAALRRDTPAFSSGNRSQGPTAFGEGGLAD